MQHVLLCVLLTNKTNVDIFTNKHCKYFDKVNCKMYHPHAFVIEKSIRTTICVCIDIDKKHCTKSCDLTPFEGLAE